MLSRFLTSAALLVVLLCSQACWWGPPRESAVLEEAERGLQQVEVQHQVLWQTRYGSSSMSRSVEHELARREYYIYFDGKCLIEKGFARSIAGETFSERIPLEPTERLDPYRVPAGVLQVPAAVVSDVETYRIGTMVPTKIVDYTADISRRARKYQHSSVGTRFVPNELGQCLRKDWHPEGIISVSGWRRGTTWSLEAGDHVVVRGLGAR